MLDYICYNILICYNGIIGDGCGECLVCYLRVWGLKYYFEYKGEE